jgi:hypothetical protein
MVMKYIYDTNIEGEDFYASRKNLALFAQLRTFWRSLRNYKPFC